MSDMDAAGMSHIGPKKGIVRERVARAWHAGSDHAAESPFGGPLCNCWQVAERIIPMLDRAWTGGWAECYEWLQMAPASQPYEPTSPYEPEEDQ